MSRRGTDSDISDLHDLDASQVDKENRRPESLGRLKQDECRRDAARAVASRTTFAFAKQCRKDQGTPTGREPGEASTELESQWKGRRSQRDATRPSDGSTGTLESSRKDSGSGQPVESRQGQDEAARSSDRESRRLGV